MINIQIDENSPDIVIINGIRIATCVIPHLLNPAEDRLFSFRRERDNITVTEHFEIESCLKFFGAAELKSVTGRCRVCGT